MRLTRDDYRRIALRVINYGMNSQMVANQFNKWFDTYNRHRDDFDSIDDL
ncbi:MAG: hypothetical protein ACXQT5_01385 [Candidatus Syntropharchaeia archaeon]